MVAAYAEATFQPTGDLPQEFSAVDPDLITEAINFTAPFIGLAEWAEDASLAHALLVGHYLKRLGYGSNGATAEPTFSRSVGPVRVGPNPSIFAKSDLQVTVYGRTYQRMFDTRGAAFGMFVV